MTAAVIIQRTKGGGFRGHGGFPDFARAVTGGGRQLRSVSVQGLFLR